MSAAPSRTFASLSLPNYRNFFFGALVSNIGTWMQRTSQDWLVLTVLTKQSPAALGVVTALAFAPMPLLAPVSGSIVDRFPKRQILLVTQLLLWLNSLALLVLTATHAITLWEVYLLAATQGIVMAFDMPCRQAFVSEMVPMELLPNAIGLNSMSFNGARLIGPGLAGLVIAAVGIAPGMAVNALTFLAMSVALVTMDPKKLTPAPLRKGGGAIREGLSYVWHSPDLMTVMTIVFAVGMFGFNIQLINASMATGVFHRDAASYGLLGTVLAVGTLAGALIAARRQQPRLRVLLASVAGLALCNLAAASTTNFWMYAVVLVPLGMLQLTALTTANSTVQLSSDPDKRGRVMAVYSAVSQGGTPLGALLLGGIGEAWGPRWALVVTGVVLGLAFVAVLGFLMRRRGIRFNLRGGWPPRLRVWFTNEAPAD